MSIRTVLARRIPALHRVTSCTQADIDCAAKRSLAHLLLVTLDAMVGLFGARVPFITISTRCALALLAAAERDPWALTAPLWALALGAFLETIDRGHLQAAMVADYARTEYVRALITKG